MFHIRDLTAAYIAGRAGMCILESVNCGFNGCTLQTCLGTAVCCHTLPTCRPCSDISDFRCPTGSRVRFADLTQQIIQNTTDPVVLQQLHDELRQLSDAAGQQSQDIVNFLNGGPAPGTGAQGPD